MIRKVKKCLCSLLTLAVLAAAVVLPTAVPAQAASGATGVGFAEHCMTAYYENWSYVYGGSSYGAVDCSGLFVTYMGVGGNRTDLLGSSSEYGLVSNGIPRIHGLGLKQPGHVGVYVGGGMAVDARDESSGICYQSVSSKNWVYWFKVAGVSYPTTGWQTFEGNQYYYQNGEYVVNCTMNIDGVVYTFGSDGIAHAGGDASQAVTTAPSSGALNQSSSSSSQSSSSSSSSSATVSAQDTAEDEAAQQAAEEKAKQEAEEAAKKAEEEAKKAKEEAEKTAASLGQTSALSVLSATAEDTSAQAEEEAKELAAQKAAEEEAEAKAAEQKAEEEKTTVAAARTDESTGDVPEMKAAAAGETTGEAPAQSEATMAFLCVLLTAMVGAGVLYGIERRRGTKRTGVAGMMRFKKK